MDKYIKLISTDLDKILNKIKSIDKGNIKYIKLTKLLVVLSIPLIMLGLFITIIGIIFEFMINNIMNIITFIIGNIGKGCINISYNMLIKLVQHKRK